MPDIISSVELPSGTTYDIKAVAIPMGKVDSTSTSTAFTATVSGISALYDGVCMWLTNGAVTSAENFTININDLGAKPVYYGNAATTRCTTHFQKAYTTLFVYNSSRVIGGCWDFVAGYDTNSTYTPQSLGFGYGTCDTASATAAKIVTLASYGLITNGIVSVKFTYAVPASATMNINSKGAKAIYYKGAAITAGIIKAGDVATFIYNGTNYILLAIDRWGTDLDSKVSSVKVGTTSYDPSSGVVSLPAYPTTLPASDTTSTYSSTGTAPVNGMAVSEAVMAYRNAIPSGDDLDDYTDCGTYYCSSAASVVCSEYNESTVALSTKIFGLTEFYLTVIGSLYNNSYPVQIIHPAIGVNEVASFYIRWYNGANTGYTEWFLFPDMNSVRTAIVDAATLIYQDMTIKNQSTINLGQTSYTPIALAQCDTAASTRQKVASIVDNATWTRNVGSIVAVKFANSNTYEATASNHITLNVNGTGDADIYYNASNANTGSSTNIYGYKNRYSFYMWNGTYWVWLSQGVDNNTTYSTITQAEIEAGTGIGARLISPALLKYAIDNWVFHSTTALANGDDLNNITTLGVYRAATVVIANSISHRPNYSDPTLKAFRLEVTDGSGTSDRQMQKLYVFNVNTGEVEEFFRFHTSSGWGSWYQAALSAVSDYVPT